MAHRHFTRQDEEAGAREAFEDAALYDFEYRRRRADVNFYRGLVAERLRSGAPGPILDLACGSGRLTLPLLRDGHTVVGLDRSGPMLARAAARVARLSRTRRGRALLVRGDLRRFAFAPRFAFVICAFHSVQHLVDTRDVLSFLRRARACLGPGGWLAFDTLPPDPAWIARDPDRRWGRTAFRHPDTGERLVYTTNHVYDERRRALHIRLYYQPVDGAGRARGAERVVRLCHRQFGLREMRGLLRRAGLLPLAVFGGWDGRLVEDDGGGDGDGDGAPHEQHVYLAKAPELPADLAQHRGDFGREIA